MGNYEDFDLNSYKTPEGKGKKKYKKKSRNRFSVWWHRRKKWQKIAVSAAAVILAVAIVLTSYVFILLGKITRDGDFNSDELGVASSIDNKIINIALFGIDTREKGCFEGLSDSIMVLSVNTKENKIKIISIMRDSLAKIDSVGTTKINTAYSSGGPQLAVKTLNSLLKLDITDYATVNFYGMTDIFDAVGGIDVEITADELNNKTRGINAMIAEQCGYMGIDLEKEAVRDAGMQHLDGIQAVAYSRIRYCVNSMGTTDDFGRTDRQRLVMSLLLDKALQMDVTSYPSFVKKILPYVKTSLSNKEILSLATALINKPSFEQMRVPMKEYIIDSDFRGTGASTVYFNWDYVSKLVYAFLYEATAPEDYITQNGVDLTPWYGSSPSGSSQSGTGTKTSNKDDVSKKTDVSSETSKPTESKNEEEPTESTSTPEEKPQESTETKTEPELSSSETPTEQTEG